MGARGSSLLLYLGVLKIFENCLIIPPPPAGAVVYVLDLFCNSSNVQTREAAAELLAKMSSDKLAGPKVKLDLSKFLPRLFSEAIRDAPKQCVHMFETKHENPELIWDDDAKAKVARIIAELKDE